MIERSANQRSAADNADIHFNHHKKPYFQKTLKIKHITYSIFSNFNNLYAVNPLLNLM